MSAEILRIVDSIHRDRDIDKELIFLGIESALISAARKRLGNDSDFQITISRETGELNARLDGKKLAPAELGRIAALTAKQVIMQKIKEAERDVIFAEFESKVGELVTGSISRFEGPNAIIGIGRAEGILSRKDQIYGESYQIGDRLKFYVRSIKKVGQKVSIELSRTHPELIRLLFKLEIPEIAEDLIDIRGLAREPGYRAKVAVYSSDPKIDSVGACVGVRGSRIKSIVDELGGEKIDIVRWSDDPAAYIIEALKPAEITEITLDEDEARAQVLVREDSLSKAIGKRGKNVRLASKLTSWEIDIISPEALEEQKAAENEIEDDSAEEPGGLQEDGAEDEAASEAQSEEVPVEEESEASEVDEAAEEESEAAEEEGEASEVDESVEEEGDEQVDSEEAEDGAGTEETENEEGI